MTRARLATLDPEYRRHYARGWRGASLEAADARGEPDAWYDGYMDLAAGREKWHRAFCEGCDHPISGPHGTATTRREEWEEANR